MDTFALFDEDEDTFERRTAERFDELEARLEELETQLSKLTREFRKALIGRIQTLKE